MYKIKYYLSGDWKGINMFCTNKNKKEHKTDLWIKTGDRQYTCNDCDCRMTLHHTLQYEEERIDE